LSRIIQLKNKSNLSLCTLVFFNKAEVRSGSRGVDWMASHPLFGVFKLEIKKINKTITEATLPPIVPILLCQVSHPLFKNPGSATGGLIHSRT